MKKDLTSLLFTVLCAVVLLPTLARAQNPTAENRRAVVTGPTHFDTTTRPLRDMVDTERTTMARGGRDFEPGRPQAVGNSNPSFIDPLAARGAGSSMSTVSLAAATTGVPVDPTQRVAPPDTTGDLGPNHYVQWVNLRYAVYNVTRDATNAITGFNLASGFPKKGNVIWSGFGGVCATDNDGDPIVQYDQFADRWVLTQFAVTTKPYTQCVAVSTSPDPGGTYNRYAYSFGTDFNDFPKMGVWSDGYYITYNMFKRGRTFAGSNVCALERDKMLVGAAARQICTLTAAGASLEPADIEGTGSTALPAAGTANPLLNITSTALNFWTYKVNWTTGTATLTGPTVVAGVAAFSRACGGGTCIPQPGTSQQLDSLGDRLNYRLSYRKFVDHETLLVNHAVATNNVTGIRWYELRNALGQTISSATPTVFQQGTFAPTADFRWMGSAAMDKTGGIGIGYNVSSSALKPSIRYTGRGPADAAGTMGIETNILTGTGSQLSTLARWGDYSTLSVDPVDGCTMVFTTEFLSADGTFNWNTHISSFKLSTCQ
jgi:hypothetical protein